MSETLKSLSITNFRAFRKLEIKRLGQVNLIVGKNNVGKTCLLEALWLYASRGSPQVLEQILTARNEFALKEAGAGRMTMVKHLFHGRDDIEKSENKPIQVGPVTDDQFLLGATSVSQSMIDQIIEAVTANTNIPGRFGNLITQLITGQWDEFKKALTFFRNTSSISDQQNIILMAKLGQQIRVLINPFSPIFTSKNLQELPSFFIASNGLTETQVAQLWNQVYLTDLQDEVERALRLIEPGIKNIGLVQNLENEGQQIAQVRVTNSKDRLLLSSLGEGMNRLFGLALALVNAKGGFLLVDEIGNGIHYSIQPELWRFVFEVAARLDIQIFATTWPICQRCRLLMVLSLLLNAWIVLLKSEYG
jgi:AAA15 family ATPase/GTPase